MSGVEDVFKGVADPMFVGGIKCDLNLQTLEVEQCVLKMHASMHAWQQQSFRHVRFIVQIVIDEIKQIVKNGLFVQLLKKEGFTCKMDSPILLVAYKELESPPVINHAIVDNVEHQPTSILIYRLKNKPHPLNVLKSYGQTIQVHPTVLVPPGEVIPSLNLVASLIVDSRNFQEFRDCRQ
ncbi:uncharacterized protein LOC116350194 isoform X2 [Contarinia nasturtii]|uniref:uncharacterized protein LOC116350035 isoform X2 n=1 Tax=Contarinia nasturtii TaxID=265458 RepID=UPI0012D3D22A|nr:uncharacterized protein LOC116350035 isoform X2 [Contarinia nasturtii]XP_031637796.1 uncharacterized protein LOC116350194 isoform X2 [Contarinia nasturtii]